MNNTVYERAGGQETHPQHGAPLAMEMPWAVPWPGDARCPLHPTCQRTMRQGPLRIDTDVAVYVCLCLACVNDMAEGRAMRGTAVMVATMAREAEEATAQC